MITRRPLRDDVRREVLSRLLNGELPPGTRLKEIALADELGVSRTPLREALHELEWEGFVSSAPGRGFTVKRFSDREIQDVLPMLWTLEALAIDGLRFDGPTLDELDAVARQLPGAERIEDVVELDRIWHQRLVAGSPNRRLLTTIDPLQDTVRRYAYQYLRGEVGADWSREHLAVTKALRAGDTTKAAALLRAHWEGLMTTLVSRMAASVGNGNGNGRVHASA